MKNKKNPSELFFSMTWDFLNEYMPKQVGRSTATIESYRDSLSLFRRFLLEDHNMSLGKFRFADCTKDCIFAFRTFLEKNGSKPSTVNVRITAIRSYLNYAADKDISVQSVALSVSRIPPCKKLQQEKEVLSEDALASILSAPLQTKMGLRDRTLMITLYDSAVRLDELLSVKLSDMNLEGEYPGILLHGKGNKERRAVLTDKAVRHLKQYLSVFHVNAYPGAYLFYTTIKGKTDKMSHGNVQRLIAHYAEIARINGANVPASVYPHMFRRTRATNLYQDGVALELVSTLLGHAHLETTKIYAQPSLSQMRNAMESVQTPGANEEPLWKSNEDAMAHLCGLR